MPRWTWLFLTHLLHYLSLKCRTTIYVKVSLQFRMQQAKFPIFNRNALIRAIHEIQNQINGLSSLGKDRFDALFSVAIIRWRHGDWRLIATNVVWSITCTKSNNKHIMPKSAVNMFLYTFRCAWPSSVSLHETSIIEIFFNNIKINKNKNE